MKGKWLFVDRDGCLVEEPADEQIDRFDKLMLMPDVIPALRKIMAAGFGLVMVTNQDGLGTGSFPQRDFDGPHQWLLALLASQGIRFHEVLIDASRPEDGLDTRKPGTGLVRHYLADDSWSRTESAMVGDRATDMAFAANLGVRGFLTGRSGLAWMDIAHVLCNRPRQARVERHTGETTLRVEVDLDRADQVDIDTGIGFFDHMLAQIARHGEIGIRLECRGDLEVDDHHSVEDCGLALGEALRTALGDRRGIARYGATLPMDDALADAAIDLSGRPWLEFDGRFPRDRVGQMSTEMVPHFFESLCQGLGANLHLSVRGDNAHHMVEACFKAVAYCLRQAVRREHDHIPSTKGVLA